MTRKLINTSLLAALTLAFAFQDGSFKGGQMKSGRVRKAYERHWKPLQALLAEKKVDKDRFDLYLRVFKQEKVLEAWVRNPGENAYVLLKSFAICASSGVLGPKRRQGDGQVPEGFYQVPSLHPYSDYHLALKVGYPNKSDRIKATAPDPGGDIMIHGNCVTIGCIPLQDEPVEELYVLCVEAKSRGRSLPVDIFPCRLDNTNNKVLTGTYPEPLLLASLKAAYDHFELKRRPAKILTDKKGNYSLAP